MLCQCLLIPNLFKSLPRLLISVDAMRSHCRTVMANSRLPHVLKSFGAM